MNKTIFYIIMALTCSILFSNEMVFVEGGEFYMGNGSDNDNPSHIVQVDSIYVSKFETTIFEMKVYYESAGMSLPPDLFSLTDLGFYYDLEDISLLKSLPMYDVSWFDALKFCNWKSEEEGLTPAYDFDGESVFWDIDADGYRLPTEAEWEYSARGGWKTINQESTNRIDFDDMGWTIQNSDGIIHPVGLKKPNVLGLYDVLGNASEWCWDYYGYGYYLESPKNNPTGPEIGTPYEGDSKSSDLIRVGRGASWASEPFDFFYRSYSEPRKLNRGYTSNMGFRIVRNAEVEVKDSMGK